MSGYGGHEDRGAAVEGQLAIDPDIQLVPVPLELSRIGEPQIDAVVPGQVVRRLRRGVTFFDTAQVDNTVSGVAVQGDRYSPQHAAWIDR